MASGRQLRRFTSLAQNEATARYGPQRSALAALLDQAAVDMATRIAAGTSAARGVGAAAQAAIPQVNQFYKDDAQRQQALYGGLSQQLAGLGSNTDPIKASALTEATMAQSELGREQTDTQTELTQRKVDAQAQRAQVIQQAYSDYAATAQKLADQRQSLAGQEGAFTSSTIQSLMQQAARDALTRRGQTLSHQDRQASLDETIRSHNLSHEDRQAAAKRTAAAKRPHTGLGSLTQGQENSQVDAINQALGYIKQLKGSVPVPTVVSLLKTGHKTKGGTTIPKLPADLVDAAADISRQGYLSPQSMAALHRRGVHVPGAWRPTRERQLLGAARTIVPQLGI